MQETFYQYSLKTELAKKYSHSTYLASPTNKPESQVILAVFSLSLFRFPYEREKFLKKARCLNKLQHPYLAPILDMGVEQDQPFIVREYLPNGSLRSYLKKLSPHRLELEKALSLVSQIGQAIACAHEHGIIHGNIKPENILLDARDQAILTDFNLISRNDAIIRDQTAEEYAFCYLAPEQLSGICDVKSDQYALGCLAYELITGLMPFAAQSLASIMGHHGTTDPTPLSNSMVNLPPSLEVAVLKALSKDPDERFGDFLLFLEVIQSVLSPPPAFPLTRPTASRDSGAISHVTQSTEPEIAVSPIRKRAVTHFEPPIIEPSRAFFNNISSAVTPEAIPQSEGSISGLSIATLIAEQETDGSLLANLFIQREEGGSSVITSLENSVNEQREHTADKAISPLIGSTSLTLPVQNRKKRPVGRFLQFSLLMGLITSASVLIVLWTANTLRPSSGIVKPDTHSYVAAKITQAAITKQQVNNFTAASSAVKATSSPTSHSTPIVKATSSPTSHSTPIVKATSSPAAKPTPTPMPTPTSIPNTPASSGYRSGWGYGGGRGGWGW